MYGLNKWIKTNILGTNHMWFLSKAIRYVDFLSSLPLFVVFCRLFFLEYSNLISCASAASRDMVDVSEPK